MNSRKPTVIIPMTASTRATISGGRLRLKAAMAALHPASIKAHSSSEPSWAPQTAEILYTVGSRVLPFMAT